MRTNYDRIRGLGDLLAFVLEPLRLVLGRFGVRTKDCGCQKRKTALNRIMPFTTNPTKSSQNILQNTAKSNKKLVQK